MTNVGNYPALANFTAQTNQDFDYTLTWKIDGVPVNLTNATAIMQLRDTLSSDAALTLRVGSGLTLGGTAGTIRIRVESTALAALDPDVYAYDLCVAQPDETPLIRGSFTVVSGVSSWA